MDGIPLHSCRCASDVVQFVEEDHVTLREFFDLYKDLFPMLAIVIEGWDGFTNYDCYENYQVMRIHGYTTQPRVLCKNSAASQSNHRNYPNLPNYLSIPVDTREMFQVVKGYNNVWRAQSLQTILEHNELPVLVKMATKASTVKVDGEDRLVENLGNLLIVERFDDHYYLLNCIDGSDLKMNSTPCMACRSDDITATPITGFRYKSAEDYEEYKRMLDKQVAASGEIYNQTAGSAGFCFVPNEAVHPGVEDDLSSKSSRHRRRKGRDSLLAFATHDPVHPEAHLGQKPTLPPRRKGSENSVLEQPIGDYEEMSPIMDDLSPPPKTGTGSLPASFKTTPSSNVHGTSAVSLSNFVDNISSEQLVLPKIPGRTGTKDASVPQVTNKLYFKTPGNEQQHSIVPSKDVPGPATPKSERRGLVGAFKSKFGHTRSQEKDIPKRIVSTKSDEPNEIRQSKPASTSKKLHDGSKRLQRDYYMPMNVGEKFQGRLNQDVDLNKSGSLTSESNDIHSEELQPPDRPPKPETLHDPRHRGPLPIPEQDDEDDNGRIYSPVYEFLVPPGNKDKTDSTNSGVKPDNGTVSAHIETESGNFTNGRDNHHDIEISPVKTEMHGTTETFYYVEAAEENESPQNKTSENDVASGQTATILSSQTSVNAEQFSIKHLTIKEVSEVLVTLNLGKHTDTFRDNQIDGEILSQLDVQDLVSELNMKKLEAVRLHTYVKSGHKPK